MFHGVIVQRDKTERLLRNIFVQSEVANPGAVLAVSNSLYNRMKPHLRVPLHNITLMSYYYEFELGSIPLELEGRFANLDAEVYRIATMNRRDGPGLIAFRCLCPHPINSFPDTVRKKMTLVSPYSGRRESWNVMMDEQLLDNEGIISTGFGYQCSQKIAEILPPYLVAPYFRATRYKI
jgi:hypothetical protein